MGINVMYLLERSWCYLIRCYQNFEIVWSYCTLEETYCEQNISFSVKQGSHFGVWGPRQLKSSNVVEEGHGFFKSNCWNFFFFCPQITCFCVLRPRWWLLPAWRRHASSSTCLPLGHLACSASRATRGTTLSRVQRSCSCVYLNTI